MSDTAWISLATIVVAICITIMVAITVNKRRFRLSFPVPFLNEPFVLSPGDSEGVHQENMMKFEAELFKKFLEITKNGEEIDQGAIQQTDIGVLEKLVRLNFLHSEGSDLQPTEISLGYLGWQALQNYLRQNNLGDNPKLKPWEWPQNF